MARNNTFDFDIISPQGVVFKEEVESVSLPSSEGIITILPHHTPLFTRLSEGEIEIKTEGKTHGIVIAGGFLEVKGNSAHVLSDYAIRAESIQEAHSLERKRQAEEKIKQKISGVEFTKADKDLKLSLLELKVAGKAKRKHQG